MRMNHHQTIFHLHLSYPTNVNLHLNRLNKKNRYFCSFRCFHCSCSCSRMNRFGNYWILLQLMKEPCSFGKNFRYWLFCYMLNLTGKIGYNWK